jgi:hypothetical protein
MSICSDVFITEEEARQRVKRMLMYNQEQLIDLAMQSMENFELTNYLNQGDDIYYYNIIEEERPKRGPRRTTR